MDKQEKERAMEVINNQNKFLADDLKAELKNGCKLKITSSCFSIYAFDELKEELKDIEELKFIFSAQTFIEDKIADKIKKESREFYILNEIRESILYGTPFEVKLSNKLTQKSIAKECSNWIREKVKFKSNSSNRSMPNFISIDGLENNVTYVPVASSITSELGYVWSDKNLMGLQ